MPKRPINRKKGKAHLSEWAFFYIMVSSIRFPDGAGLDEASLVGELLFFRKFAHTGGVAYIRE